MSCSSDALIEEIASEENMSGGEVFLPFSVSSAESCLIVVPRPDDAAQADVGLRSSVLQAYFLLPC
jgi:hypothetical protein